MSDGYKTPLDEAISIITIAAILVAVGCYVAALQNVPWLSPSLFWIAVQVYDLFPRLKQHAIPSNTDAG